MWFKKGDDLKLPKLSPRKGERSLGLPIKSFKKVELSKTLEEPEILKKVDLSERTRKVEPEFYFWICDGRVIKDVKDLTQAMRNMREDVFNFHVTEYKNEFSDWIRSIVKDEKLADEISRAKTSEEAYAVLSGKKVKVKKKKSVKEILKTKIPGLRKGEEVKEEKLELGEIEEAITSEALKEEEAGLEKEEEAEEVVEKPEAVLPYEKKIIPKPKKEEVIKRTEVKEVKEVKKRVGKTKQNVVGRINKMLEEANYLVNQGDAAGAKSLTTKSRSLLKRASISKQEKKKLNHKIIDIETKAKLFMLS